MVIKFSLADMVIKFSLGLVFLGHLDLVISREKSIYKGLHPMSSGVVHHNINFRNGRSKRILGLPCLGDSENPLSNLGKNCSRRSVTIQSSRISLLSRVVMGAGLLSTLWLGRQASECDPTLHPPVCVSFAPYSSTSLPATFAPLPYVIDSFCGS